MPLLLDRDIDAAADAFNALVRTPVTYFSDDDDWEAPGFAFGGDPSWADDDWKRI